MGSEVQASSADQAPRGVEVKMYVVLGTAPLGADRIHALSTDHRDYLIAFPDLKESVGDLSCKLVTKLNELERNTNDHRSQP